MSEEIKNESTEAAADKAAPKKKKKEVAALEEKVAELEAKLAELEDKHLRLAAEYDNFRRRSREEREGVYAAAVGDAAAAMLPIIDNLERAGKFEDGAKVLEGLKMINGTVAEALSAMGVEAFGEVGESFDPNIHNAVMHEEDDSGREGEITEVFQRGYKKGKHIIRFAMVKTVN